VKENKLSHLKTLLETNPLWYQNEEIKQCLKFFGKEKLNRKSKSLKKDFKELLKNSNYYITNNGYNWDQWRQPIEFAVVHHTSSSPTISLKELNILGLRLYIEQFLKDEDVKDQPLYSGHYWFDKEHITENMTFVNYHYLVRPNGKIIQLTDDSAFLWHAGNLEVNRKSIGIALAGKFMDKEPTEETLHSVAEIIRNHKIDKRCVFGHKEVIKKEILGETECPGNTFIESWKNKLIMMI
jgi:hypothetical protein